MLNTMRFLIFLFALLLLSANAQPVKKNMSYIVIPLVFKSGYPSVIATIQGIKIPLQFDLGAVKTEIALSETIIKKYHIKVIETGKLNYRRDTQGIIIIGKEFILPHLKLGDLILNNVQIVVSDVEKNSIPGGRAPSPKIAKNGLIGLGLVNQFNVIIDYKNAKLILINGDAYPPGYHIDSWRKISFVMDENIITSSQINNKTIHLLWDTGAPYNWINPNKISGENILCPQSVIDELHVDSTHCNGIKTTLMMSNHPFKNNIFYINLMKGLPADGVIGEPFFKKHIVYINFTKKTLAIK